MHACDSSPSSIGPRARRMRGSSCRRCWPWAGSPVLQWKVVTEPFANYLVHAPQADVSIFGLGPRPDFALHAPDGHGDPQHLPVRAGLGDGRAPWPRPGQN